MVFRQDALACTRVTENGVAPASGCGLSLFRRYYQHFALTMTIHPLSIHYGPHLAGVFVPRAAFAHQLVSHLNTCLGDTTHQFVLQTFGVADLPPPEPNPHVLPDEFNVDLYLFSNADHPTRNGTISIDGKGDARLFVPCPSLQVVNDPVFYLPAYTQVLGTTMHEFEHNWRRGEQRYAKFVDPPTGVDMPRVNYWSWPSTTDPYWSQDKRDWVLDPFGVSQPVGHPLFVNEVQDLAWVLANMRPSRGTRAIMRGKRGDASHNDGFKLEMPGTIGQKTVQAWAIPAHYEDPWTEHHDMVWDDDKLFVGWPETEHGHPFMGLRVTSTTEERAARGYVCIFDLEHHNAVYGGHTAVVTADFATGRINFPRIVYPPTEAEVAVARVQAWQRWIRMVWARWQATRTSTRAPALAPTPAGARHAVPTSREAWEVKCDHCVDHHGPKV